MNSSPLIKVSEPIGIIDSGVGGLSILNSLITLLPSHTFIYVADAAHLPYGQKSPDYLLDRATRITKFLQSQGVSTIFVACHTLSATVLSLLQLHFPTMTYIDMLPGTVHKASKLTKTKQIGVMATTATIASHTHKKLLQNIDVTLALHEQACPLFVELIEKRAPEQELDEAITSYLTPLLTQNVDTIILGCTHYPFIQTQLEQKAPHVTFVSAANTFPELSIKNDKLVQSSQPTIRFITTASREYLKQAVTRYFEHHTTCTVSYETHPSL